MGKNKMIETEKWVATLAIYDEDAKTIDSCVMCGTVHPTAEFAWETIMFYIKEEILKRAIGSVQLSVHPKEHMAECKYDGCLYKMELQKLH